jgi:hypothetical protein
MNVEKIFDGVTLSGLPVRIELEWPFHPSAGGSDWYVLHGTLRLGDGGPLRADLALNLAQTVRELLPALDSDFSLWLTINTARTALDDKQLELLKSGKRQPVPVSSRCYSIRDHHFRFWNATFQQVEDFLARKIFWLSGADRKPVMISDPCDAQYLGAADPNMVDSLVSAARDLAARGLIELAGDYARATDRLVAQTQSFHAAKEHALEQLHVKHAYERA